MDPVGGMAVAVCQSCWSGCCLSTIGAGGAWGNECLPWSCPMVHVPPWEGRGMGRTWGRAERNRIGEQSAVSRGPLHHYGTYGRKATRKGTSLG